MKLFLIGLEAEINDATGIQHNELKKVHLGQVAELMPYWHGRYTYHYDFLSCIVPELKKHFEIVDKVEDAGVIFCPSATVSSSFKFDGRIIVNLHGRVGDANDDKVLNKHSTEWEFICHFKPFVDKWKHKYKIHYIPMGIDLDRLPKNTVHSYDKIYFGNLSEEKIDVYSKLKKEHNFDTLSFGHLNDSKFCFTPIQCLNIVSRYKIGFGVGICATEMLSMGLRVIVAGDYYGGCINFKNLQNHRETNFNSTYNTADKILHKVSANFFDMKKFAYRYVQIINGE